MRFRFLMIATLGALAAGAVALTAWSGGVAAPRSGSLLADNRPSAIPVDTELVCRAQAGETTGRRFHVHAAVTTADDDTTVLAEADATYVLMVPKEIA